ncbi:hypothetical protein [Leuconostoc carnosum]|uniref:hypothetical protein n=1 Tax=Leuconostoc carnosum TaxID=1252 RepID=UPI0016805B93|nr:hypothetical protein [Leuconostoc carnosum]
MKTHVKKNSKVNSSYLSRLKINRLVYVEIDMMTNSSLFPVVKKIVSKRGKIINNYQS